MDQLHADIAELERKRDAVRRLQLMHSDILFVVYGVLSVKESGGALKELEECVDEEAKVRGVWL